MEQGDVEVVADLMDDWNELGQVIEGVYYTFDLTHTFMTIDGDSVT